MKIRIREFASAYKKYSNYREIIHLISKGVRPTHLVTRGGIEINGRAGAQILDYADEIIFKRSYNPDILPIEPNDVVVDIGAHQGVFTMLAASITGNAVHAIEPLPENAALIRSNATVNSFQHVHVHEMAISDKTGSIELHVSSQMGSLADRPDSKTVSVKTHPLTWFMDNRTKGRIDFLKMDCEGSEGLIFRSTPIEYLKRIGKIAMEFHTVSAISRTGIIKLLETAGFTVNERNEFPDIIYARNKDYK